MKIGTIVIISSTILWILNNQYFGWDIDNSNRIHGIIEIVAIAGIVTGITMNVRRALGLDKVRNKLESVSAESEVQVSSDDPIVKKAIAYAEELYGKPTPSNLVDFMLCVSSFAKGYVAAKRELSEESKEKETDSTNQEEIT